VNALQRVAGALVGIALFIAAFVFASIIFAVAAVLALMVWGWLMWRTRDLRRAFERAQGTQGMEGTEGAEGAEGAEGTGRAEGAKGTVIEGEYRVEREVHRIDEGR